jgi:hypothetical protein
MPSSPSWQVTFVAMTVALGDSLEDARAALGPAGWSLDDVTALRASLSQAAREVRARALASALAHVALELDGAKLA